jgi:hypothetical protein
MRIPGRKKSSALPVREATNAPNATPSTPDSANWVVCRRSSLAIARTALIATATIPPTTMSRPVAVQTIVKAMNGRVASAMPSQPPTADRSDGGPAASRSVALPIHPPRRSIGR